ncbi:SRPBCC family protein [Streptomyces sp. NBC_01485]|uniref:SRPBCC family protein n=1 Tax=Streptomyces sp. NBC_01485 TaxID=2903884 RepID=UPI002E37B6DA|nr:SRPBCC family protein [Streptomyces sp. NBC_01485]
MTERSDGQTSGGLGTLTRELPTDRFLAEAQNLLAALGERAVANVTDKVEDLAHGGGLGGGLGPKVALAGGKHLLSEGASQLKSAVGGGISQVTEKAKETVSGGLGGGDGDKKNKKITVVNIVEQIDVGLPVSDAYNQWTQFEDFPGFMKKVEDVEQESETETNWKAQIFLSHRKWKATVIEQAPDELIVWESKGDKGHVDGAVTFHEVGPRLTRILLVLQYYPQGMFERTGNLWRAQGRRARLELKHFRRHAMSQVLLHPEEVEGWRGEVRDGEVVRSDEEVRDQETADEEEQGEEQPEEQPEDAYDEAAEGEEGEPRDEEEEEPEEEEPAAEDEEPEEDEPEDEEPAGHRRRRSSAKAR